MSYDIDLEIDTGGEEPLRFGDWNYTSNCGPMWREAGADLAEFEGKPAADCRDLLDKALAEMVANPGKYRAMDPSNGWGSYDTLLPRLRVLRDLCAAHPKATVRVWR